MIGDMIKEKRLEMGFTQAQLSKLTGIKSTTISNYENNISSPSEENIYKLMDVLECDANYLFEWEEVKDVKLSAVERKHIKKYRTLDEHGKDIIDTILEKEYERCTEAEKSKESKPAIEVEPTNTKPSKTYTGHAVAFGGASKHVEVTQEKYNDISDLPRRLAKKD